MSIISSERGLAEFMSSSKGNSSYPSNQEVKELRRMYSIQGKTSLLNKVNYSQTFVFLSSLAKKIACAAHDFRPMCAINLYLSHLKSLCDLML